MSRPKLPRDGLTIDMMQKPGGKKRLNQWKGEKFCREFAVSGNLRAALEAAGWGKTRATREILSNVWIVDRVRELREEMYGHEWMGLKENAARLARIARGDIRDLFDENGALIEPQRLTDIGAAVVAGFECEDRREVDKVSGKVTGTTPIIKVKLRDPTAALAILAKINKLVEGEPVVQVNITLAERMRVADERVKALRVNGHGVAVEKGVRDVSGAEDVESRPVV